MSSTPLEPLSAETERLLANERRLEPASAELRFRALARARSALRDGSESVRPYAGARYRMPLLVAATLVLVAAASFAAFRNLQSGARLAELGSPAPLETKPISIRPAPAAAAPPLPEKSDGAAEPGRRDEVEAPGAERRSPASDTDAIELGLLQRARGALARGEFSAALAAISEHQRRFPSGRLREEREALRVKALSGLGRTDEAQRAAERFRERFPESVLAPRIEGAIRKGP